MKTDLECFPCFLKQTLSAAAVAKMNRNQTQKAVKEVLNILKDINMELPPPLMGRDIHNIIKKISENPDPYKELKNFQNNTALKLLDELKNEIAYAEDSFETAVKFSIAGNAIDLGTSTTVSADVKDSFKNALAKQIDKAEVSKLKKEIENSKKILFLADNSGEIIFDIPLMEYIGKEKLTVAVRSNPIINDVTLKEAEQCKISSMFKVIENGSDLPGTWLDECRENFKNEFESSDLIISKGQGNFETLSSLNRSIFYLFLVKCKVIAKITGQKPDTFIIQKI
ncbi:MAG: DUF89 family protein [Deltaproteobacteria bacterium]|nr:DUF89 family protein [Deltaproteobacteria bacterium]